MVRDRANLLSIPGRRYLWAGLLGLLTSGSLFAGEPEMLDREKKSLDVREELAGLAPVRTDQEPAFAEPSWSSIGSAESTGGGDEPAEPWTLSSVLFESESARFIIGGWTQNGYSSNSTGLFNANPDQFVSDQDYLYLERRADGSEGLDWGFRGDILYGADAQDTQAFGDPAAPADGHWDNPWDNGFYGWALPQLYGELAYGDFSVKVGHFYTPLGYEVIPGTGNFFYSHSFTMYNSEPFTHTGALGTYTPSEDVTLYGGWVAGWDTGFSAKTDLDHSRGSAYLGGATLVVTDTLTLTYLMLVGDMGIRGEGYNHSIVLNWQITEKLNYVALSDLDEFNNSTFGPNHTIGLDHFLIYKINKVWALGGRAEWWKPNGHSVYQLTGGLNITPIANLRIRPEIRYQWGADRVIESLHGFNGRPGVSDTAIFGIDAIVTF